MRIAMLVDVSGSMAGVGAALAQAFCMSATPQTVQDGKMTLISFGAGAAVECVDVSYADFNEKVRALDYNQGSTNVDAALVEVNKLGKFDYIYILCDGYPNGGRGTPVSGKGPEAQEIQQTILNSKALVCIFISTHLNPTNPLKEWLTRVYPPIANEPTVDFTIFGFNSTFPIRLSNLPYQVAERGFYSEDHS